MLSTGALNRTNRAPRWKRRPKKRTEGCRPRRRHTEQQRLKRRVPWSRNSAARLYGLRGYGALRSLTGQSRQPASRQVSASAASIASRKDQARAPERMEWRNGLSDIGAVSASG